MQMTDDECIKEAVARQLYLPAESNGRAELMRSLEAELQLTYGNVNTLITTAEKLVRANRHRSYIVVDSTHTRSAEHDLLMYA